MEFCQEFYQDAKSEIWVRHQSFTPRCTLYRPDDRYHRAKKNFFRFHFPIAHWIGHVLQTKVYKNIIPLVFVSQKLLKFINYWNQGFHNENTNIKCIYYINNMFSKIFINQAFKSYTSFDFIYTYSRYRFNIIKLWW